MQRPRIALLNLSIALLTLSFSARLLDPATQPVALAQSEAPVFPMPSSVPDGSTVKLDGSPSLTVTNAALKQQFEQQFSGAKVELAATGIDGALQALLDGKLDVVAIGRSLTPDEIARGLRAAPMGREKIALIVGKENPFRGDISFSQFAKIFRGEITDWSELGGAAGAIRVVDRPDSNDTRQSLSQYKVFRDGTFATGANATKVTADDIDTTVQALGKDGISYAIANQVFDRADVHIVSMHKTLPNDPRYPYSQPKGYVYDSQKASPAAQAFLGFAASPTGQEIASNAKPGAAGVAAGAIASKPAVSPATSPNAEASPAVSPVAPEASPAASPDAIGSPAAPNAAPSPAISPTAPPNSKGDTTALLPAPESGVATDAGRTEGLGWLWWLLLPLLAGLFWWIFKRGRRPVEETGVGLPPGREAGVSEASRSLDLPSTEITVPPIAKPNLGAIPAGGVAAGAAAVGAAAVGAAAMAERWKRNRLSMTTHERELNVNWEVPQDHEAALREQGGQKKLFRLYDVTGVDLERQAPNSVKQFDCDESASLKVPLETGDRDYIGELGYTTADNRWLKLARSPRIRVPTLPAIGAVGAVGAVGAAATTTRFAPPAPPSSISLVPLKTQEAYVSWEVPEAHKEALRQQGGRKLQLRLHDATDINLDQQPAHSTQQYECDESSKNKRVAVAEGDRDYVAELGYTTEDHRWLRIARSTAARIPKATGAVGAVGAVGAAAGLAAASQTTTLQSQTVLQNPSSEKCAISTLRVNSKTNCFVIEPHQMERLQSEVAATKSLEPGNYMIRIKNGGFSYGVSTPSEPMVMLWIYGGRVINQKTKVPVQATWSTLNGYADTLNLQVLEPATLCAFFMDTHGDDNQGEVTLSTIKV
jgi:phosphate transport system substrate-binding protein